MARKDFLDGEEIVNRLNKAFEEHKRIVIESTAALSKLQGEYSKLPSDYLKMVKEISNALKSEAQAEKELANARKANEQATQAKIKTERDELNLKKQKAAVQDKDAKNLQREAAKLAAAESLYAKLRAKLHELNLEYRDLAAKKELGIKLSDDEAKRLAFLEARTKRYRTALSAVNVSMGNYRDNVGNYASAFNPLQNSLNQLTREMPAFSNSVQTGFMAISNNLPIFFDAISQANSEIKALRAQGQQVPGLFKQLTSSLFSFGTVLSIGVTLLTIYGEEITDWAAGLFKGSQALNATQESQKQLNDITKEAVKSITQERIELQNNLSIARDTTLSYREREIAAQKVLDQYPYWFESLGKEAIMNGNVQKAIEGVNAALLARAKAAAAVDKITENQSKVIDLEEQLLTVRQNIERQQNKLNTLLELQQQGRLKDANSILIAERAVRNGKAEEAGLLEEINGLNEINNRLTSYSLQSAKESIGLEYKAANDKKKAAEDEVYAETNSRVAFENTISAIERKLSLMSKENRMYGVLETQLKIVKDAYEALYGEQEKSNQESEKAIKYGTEDYYTSVIGKLKEEQAAVADSTEQYEMYSWMIQTVQDELDKLTGKQKEVGDEFAKTNEYLKQFSQSVFQDNGLTTMFKILNKEIEGFGENTAVTVLAVSEAFQEMYAFMNQNSQAYFDAQYSRLNQEKEIALKYAGESTEAKEEIERQYQEKQREIKQKEWKANRDAALFNIALNMAQGITAALASVPPNPVLAATIGAIGLAQAALVASRPIPAYFKGTDNHTGGLMLVNDAPGSNYKEVIETPSGQLYTPQGRNVVVDAPKGTKVHKNYDSFRESLERMLDINDIAPFASTLFRQMPDVVINNGGGGITKDEMAAIMKNSLSQITIDKTTIDENGINKWFVNKNSRTTYFNAKKHGKGGAV